MAIELDLSGRVALVVGGGGGGIGSAVCERLAEAGADVAAVGIDPDHLAATRRAVEDRGCRAATAVADVTDLDALVDALDATATELGTFDTVVNVVGGVPVAHWHRLEDYPIASFDHLLTTNLRYAFIVCQHVARALIDEQRPGSMVNISSIASGGQALLAGYSAAKAGLDSLTRVMAVEWGRHGIRVNNVAPGTVNTPRSGRAVDEQDEMARSITLGRRGRPRDIADGAVFLLSDLASYITGQTLVVDGGPSRAAIDEFDLPVAVTNMAIRSRFT